MSFPFSLSCFLLQIVDALYQERPETIQSLTLVETFSFPSFFLETEKDIGALYLDEEKKEAYLVFRGTTNYTETIIDLEFHQTEFIQKTFPLDFEIVEDHTSPDLLASQPCSKQATSASTLLLSEAMSRLSERKVRSSPDLLASHPSSERMLPCSEPLVHCGFYKIYSYLSQKVNLALHGLSVEKLYISGHSMGAALALLFTCALPSRYQKHTFLFACPRVGNYEFVKRAEQSAHVLYNVQNETDVVPQLPAPLTFGYAYSSPGRICIFRKVKPTLVDNHHAETYLEGLSEERLISS